MNYKGLQQGIKKAKKRTPWRKSSTWMGDEEKCLGIHRKVTKMCSAAIHGCGHIRDLIGITNQEKRSILNQSDEY